MFGLTTDPSNLSIILEPLSWQLDQCWWYLGSNGANLSSDDYSDYERLTDNSLEYLVGKPGWYRRFIGQADTNWAVYVACDCELTDMPCATLELVHSNPSLGWDWFGDISEWELPSDVAFVCRDVDDARWDLFFRDESMFKVTRDHLRRFPAIACRSFVAGGSDSRPELM